MLEKEIVLQEDIMKRNFLNCWMGWGKSTRNFIREVRKEVFLGYSCFIPAQILGPGSVPLFVPHRKRWRGYRPRPWNLLHVSAVRNPCFQFFYKTSAFHINLHNPDYFWCLSFSSKRSYVHCTSIDKKRSCWKMQNESATPISDRDHSIIASSSQQAFSGAAACKNPGAAYLLLSPARIA